MALTDGFPGTSGTVNSVELRKNLAGLIVRDTAGNPRGGIFPRHTNALITARTDMAVDVQALEGASIRGGGPVLMANDGATRVPLTAAPIANSRIDVVYFKQNESGAPFTDGDNSPIFGVKEGSASGSPTEPSLSTIPGAVKVGTVLVPTGKTATNQSGVVINTTCQFTATSGGTVLVRNDTDLQAWTPVDGSRAYQLDISTAFIRVNGAWVADAPTYGVITPVAGVTVNAGTKFIKDPDGWVHGYIDLTRLAGLGSDIAVVGGGGFRPVDSFQTSGAASEGGAAGFAFVRVAVNGNVSALTFPASDTRLQFTFGWQGTV